MSKIRPTLQGMGNASAHAQGASAKVYISKPWRSSLVVVCVLLGVAISIASFAWMWLFHEMRSSLPQIDGKVVVSGLSSDVVVVRDAHGVPHIRASSLNDLVEAQGYITAQDRLWQMDMERRIAEGTAAEILGTQFLRNDQLMRTLAIRATAESMVSRLSPTDHGYLVSYAAGVNRLIQVTQKRLPAEFALLHYSPRPWEPVDSIAISLQMAYELDNHWQEKYLRERISTELGSSLADDLYPAESVYDMPPGTDTTVSSGREMSSQSLIAPTKRRPSTPSSDVERLLKSLNDCPECRPGSNEWVVSGKNTTSGKPILANDMHLALQVPSLWYEAELNAGPLHVAGVTLPGLPFVVAGHNATVAWGLTSLNADTQDLYIEKTNARGDYLDGARWLPFNQHSETVHVRWHSDVTIKVMSTSHGPVVSKLLNDKRIISLRWSAYDPSCAAIPLLGLNLAANWQDFREVLSRWWGPSMNFVYADKAGNIGYQAAGFLPQRPEGLVGVPIADDHNAWHGFIPFADLPTVLNPSSGLIATANSRITPPGYPYELSLEWASPYRNARIWNWLSQKGKSSQADMSKFQMDVYSSVNLKIAQRLVLAVRASRNRDPLVLQASQLLSQWNGYMTTESSAATIVWAFKDSFWLSLLKPRLGDDWHSYRWEERDLALEMILNKESALWLPKGCSSWDKFLVSILAESLKAKHAPSDLKRWSYGGEHTIHLQHPIFQWIPWFRRRFGTGLEPESGDSTTVMQMGKNFGPSQRFTIDWSDPDKATENLVTGQSDNPLSPWYLDQWSNWYHAVPIELPFTPDAVQRAGRHVLYLKPGI